MYGCLVRLGRRVHDITSLRYFSVCVRVGIWVLCVLGSICQRGVACNDQTVGPFARLPELAFLPGLPLGIAYHGVCSCHRHVVVPANGAQDGVLSRAVGACCRFYLVVRLLEGVEGGGQLTIFRRDQVQFRGGGQFFQRVLVDVRLITVYGMIRSCNCGLRIVVLRLRLVYWALRPSRRGIVCSTPRCFPMRRCKAIWDSGLPWYRPLSSCLLSPILCW